MFQILLCGLATKAKMPLNVALNEKNFEEFTEASDVKAKTREDRERQCNYFAEYMETNI